MESEETRLLGEPFDLTGALRLRNRFVATAHGRAAVYDGLPSAADADYWRRVSQGGVGMCIAGGTVVAPHSTHRTRMLTEAWRPEAFAGLRLRAEAMHAGGAAAVLQLLHLGRETLGAEIYHYPVAPSAVRSPREPTSPRALTEGEIDEIVEGFRVSARHAAEAGFDGIELHAAHGYLLAQFLSPAANRRAGAEAVAGRLELLTRVAQAVRSAAPGKAIGVRMSVGDPDDAGLDLDQVEQVLGALDPAFDPALLCTVNPDLAAPGDRVRRASPLVRGSLRPGRVAIVGAGPAGLEAALTLQRAGAEVVVFEQEERIGGTIGLVAGAPSRSGWHRIVDFYARSLDLELRLGRRAEPEAVAGFDALVIATGAVEAGAHSVTEAIAAGTAGLAGVSHLLIVDDGFGWWPAVNALELAIAAGVERVTIATPGTALATGIPGESRVGLIKRLRGKVQLELRPLTDAASGIEADAVVVVGERRPRYWSAFEREDRGIVVIGDAIVPRRVAHAISEGRAAAALVLAGPRELAVAGS